MTLDRARVLGLDLRRGPNNWACNWDHVHAPLEDPSFSSTIASKKPTKNISSTHLHVRGQPGQHERPSHVCMGRDSWQARIASSMQCSPAQASRTRCASCPLRRAPRGAARR
jgi:hypothetical protein